MDNITKIVLNAIGEHFYLDSITLGTKIKDIIVDFSTQWEGVLTDIEMDTDVYISMEEFEKMETIQDLINFIQGEIAGE